jgi:uncharacterized membrane protein YukC
MDYTEFPFQIKRQFAGPLDVSSVFQTTAERDNYLATSEEKYAGQCYISFVLIAVLVLITILYIFIMIDLIPLNKIFRSKN